MDYQKEVGIIGMGKWRCNLVLGMNFKKCPLKNLSEQFLKAKSSFFMMAIQDPNTPA